MSSCEILQKINSSLVQTASKAAAISGLIKANPIPVKAWQDVNTVAFHDPTNCVVQFVVGKQELH